MDIVRVRGRRATRATRGALFKGQPTRGGAEAGRTRCSFPTESQPGGTTNYGPISNAAATDRGTPALFAHKLARAAFKRCRAARRFESCLRPRTVQAGAANQTA